MKEFLYSLCQALYRTAKRKMLIGTHVVTDKDRQRLYKARFLQAFVVCVLMLALVKWVWLPDGSPAAPSASVATPAAVDSVGQSGTVAAVSSRYRHADGSRVKNRIFSVSSFKNTFPDLNDVQIESARKYGVSPVQDRQEAEHRKKELVYVGSDPYFHVDNLSTSIPYLVPRAAVLLHDIGKAFFDSLYMKDIPFHKIIITSVTRTKSDVERLRRGNLNATDNSCHLYGTTVDICYNRYKTVEPPEGPARRQVRNDSLKWILSEVLRDFRNQNRCYIKYEVKQGCFHLTVK